jgi:hypothetical protein
MLAQTTATGDLSTGTIIAIVIAVVLIVAVIALTVPRQRSQRLKERFGPEYDRTLDRTGSQARSERELAAREQRHQKLDIRPLTPGARTRYSEEWRTIQARFVDDPSLAVTEADRVIVEVMRDRGYPVDDSVSQRVDDLSVDHASVIDNYRVARDIARRNARHEASTEELRRATVSYRTLFEDLLGDDVRTTSPTMPGAAR